MSTGDPPTIVGSVEFWQHQAQSHEDAADALRAEVERLRAALTKWDNSLCGCCCHACTELGNVADGLSDPT